MEIQELLRQYAGHPQIAATRKLLADEKINNLFLQGLNGSGAAMAIASLFTKGGGAFLCLLNDQEEAGYFYHDLNQLTDGNGIYFFPSAYRRAIKYGHIDPANEILRTETLSLLQSPDKPFSRRRIRKKVKETTTSPQIAYLKDGTICIEPLTKELLSDI